MEKVQLLTAGFGGWMESEEGSLSKAGDGLDLLESRERRLSGIWESGARQLWAEEFRSGLLEVRESIADMTGLLQKTQQAAEELLQVERALIREAEKL